MFVILICVLLHNQNDGWNLPKLYFIFSCKDIYLRIFLTYIALSKLSYVFFWVVPRGLEFKCQRFGTLCLFHLHGRVGMKCESG
jgi:uncharacterized membrane protein